MQTYKVIVTGQLLPGANPQQVRQQLRELFQLQQKPEQLERFFQQQTVTIKRKLDQKTARDYQEAIRNAGMECSIEAEPNEAPFNPYQQPSANLEHSPHQQTINSRTLRITPAQLDAIHGKIWYSEAYALFKQQPGTLIGITLLFILCCFAVGFINGLLETISPILALPFNIAFNLAMPIVTISFMLIFHKLTQGENINARMLLLGFQNKTVVKRMFAMMGLLVAFFVLIFGASAALSFMMKHDQPLAILTVGLIFLLTIVPVIMAIWFAPALIALHNMELKPALLLSLQGCWQNKMAFLIYGLIGMLFAILASIPLMLGWLVLIPISYATIYTSYQQIFTEEA